MRQELGCSWEDLATQQIEPPTWRLTERLRTLEIAGILVRSFALGCTAKNQNLVLWQWSALEPNSVLVIDDFGRLHKSTESWCGNKMKLLIISTVGASNFK